MVEEAFFLSEPGYTPLPAQRPDVVRLMHTPCAGVEFRRVPPGADASTFEIGRGTGGMLYLRERLGGTSQAQSWRPADGVVACATCWNSQRLDNPAVDLATGREFTI